MRTLRHLISRKIVKVTTLLVGLANRRPCVQQAIEASVPTFDRQNLMLNRRPTPSRLSQAARQNVVSPLMD